MTFMKTRSATSIEKMVASVDWEGRPDTMCTCKVCGSQFASPSKFVFSNNPSYVSLLACPSCGSHELSAAHNIVR